MTGQKCEEQKKRAEKKISFGAKVEVVFRHTDLGYLALGYLGALAAFLIYIAHNSHTHVRTHAREGAGNVNF